MGRPRCTDTAGGLCSAAGAATASGAAGYADRMGGAPGAASRPQQSAGAAFGVSVELVGRSGACWFDSVMHSVQFSTAVLSLYCRPEASLASLRKHLAAPPHQHRQRRRGGLSRCVMAARDVLHASAAGGLAETSCYGLAAAVGEAPTVAVPHGRVFARGSQHCSYATV